MCKHENRREIEKRYYEPYIFYWCRDCGALGRENLRHSYPRIRWTKPKREKGEGR